MSSSGASTNRSEAITIEVASESASEDDRSGIECVVRTLLSREGRAAAALSVAIVDDATMAGLHRRYLGIDGPTDVLSFDLSDDAGDGVDGQVVVSVDTARREARARKLDARGELLRYVVHGVLHLLGYDDDTASGKRRMHEVEDDVLRACGFAPGVDGPGPRHRSEG